MPLNLTPEGFTLLEILLVVVIVGILTAVSANIINSQSTERVILNQAQKFSHNLKFVCEKAVLENQAFGIQWYNGGYQVLRHQQSQWNRLESQSPQLINAAIQTELLLDGLPQQLLQASANETENLPHIICQTDGSFNSFELRLSVVSAATELSTYYALRTESPWQLEGAWYQP